MANSCRPPASPERTVQDDTRTNTAVTAGLAEQHQHQIAWRAAQSLQLLRHTPCEPRPSLMVVTVQREVAGRVVAEPGGMSLLAVSVQLYGRPRIVAQIPAGAFYPRPQVDSAVLRIEVCGKPKIVFDERLTEKAFFRTVRAGFRSRRKTLRNSLSGGLGLPRERIEAALVSAGIDPGLRAQRLSLQEWGRIAQALWA